MYFQQPRKIRPPRVAPFLLVIFVLLCTFYTLYSPSIQYFQKLSTKTEAYKDHQHSIRTTELVKEYTSSHQENLDVVEVDNSSLEPQKPHEENVDDVEVDNSSSLKEDKTFLQKNEDVVENEVGVFSSSKDIKVMEENDGIQQSTSPNWPDVTADELFKKDPETKKTHPNNKENSARNLPRSPVKKRKEKESDRQQKTKKSRKHGRKKGNQKQNDKNPPPPPPPPPPPVPEYKNNTSQESLDALVSDVEDKEHCDIFSGEWFPNPEAPYYTNMTCIHIQEHQNCMKFGKPDKGYMKWRWKPDNECELPLFDPHQFLEQLRGKSLAFVGDSVARNHMQSLICLLSPVILPIDISNNTDENFKRFKFSDYNFTISIFWAPYLVRAERSEPNDVTRPYKLYLDEFDEYWPTQVESYDYIIISAGQWFFRPTMFYINRTIVGCLYCPDENVTHLSSHFSYQRAFRTAFNAINNLNNFKGVTFLRTFATSHFEGGPWDKGGDCIRTKPSKRNETTMEDYSLEIYRIQIQELKIAQKVGGVRGLKFRLFDATRPMFLRPDGHPSQYGRHKPKQNISLANDCVHWCLPGPIDTLNDFLQELITREFQRMPTSVSEQKLAF
ncbi:hypothetical protein Leryth_005282 [Lithospermum erythrorhizon]|nr:hypothetical protein Leryth_005282 [Lithospermum erythrorhizon]